ncbi:hypothetical protein FHY13_001041 [Xanthomonas arboricola]|uniref:hypothetical protein n=1 Tax=Xanthomonas euroxanthea TaxID=2259622 RepID=UPI00161FEB5C|nr:hypothetical protein [Xanthomonas euroxanthea]
MASIHARAGHFRALLRPMPGTLSRGGIGASQVMPAAAAASLLVAALVGRAGHGGVRDQLASVCCVAAKGVVPCDPRQRGASAWRTSVPGLQRCRAPDDADDALRPQACQASIIR